MILAVAAGVLQVGAKRRVAATFTVVILLRVLIGALIVAIAAVAIVPLLVLIDLVDGGSGWGICPEGLAICRSSYFDGPELFAVLLIVMGGLAFVLHVTIVIYRKLGARAARRSLDLSGQG